MTVESAVEAINLAIIDLTAPTPVVESGLSSNTYNGYSANTYRNYRHRSFAALRHNARF